MTTTHSTERAIETGPAVTEIDALHLRINQSWLDGSCRTIHFQDNPDLGVLLHEGTKACQGADGFTSDNVEGHVVIALGVDGEHDEVHYGEDEYGPVTALTRAIDSLTACRDALVRVRESQS